MFRFHFNLAQIHLFTMAAQNFSYTLRGTECFCNCEKHVGKTGKGATTNPEKINESNEYTDRQFTGLYQPATIPYYKCKGANKLKIMNATKAPRYLAIADSKRYNRFQAFYITGDFMPFARKCFYN